MSKVIEYKERPEVPITAAGQRQIWKELSCAVSSSKKRRESESTALQTLWESCHALAHSFRASRVLKSQVFHVRD